MNVLVWLIPAFPLAGFVVLATLGGRLPRTACAVIGAGSVGLSMLASAAAAVSYLGSTFPGPLGVGALWGWMDVPGLRVWMGVYLDALSLLWVLVIAGVGFLIHLYSTVFMAEHDGYSRFFAYLNLFVASMLILVLADNLLLMYLGWEGVGLCSYLLIGFWYREPANTSAAVKAFVVTRVGDAALILGIILLFTSLGGTGIQEILSRAGGQWQRGAPMATAAAALLLAGAVGKSAQLPLQTWLPDAMAGPTPVSALIHAATMVTAGVYLIARMNVLFALAPTVHLLVGVIGGATLVLAGFSATVQRDIKRVLAYSTISQIGYMFLALGVGAWQAAAFHFMTHACFKSLLFLGAGCLIMYLHEDHDIFHMGGLWRRMPVVFWTFLIGGMSMAAFPPLLSGFFSKDWILSQVFASTRGSLALSLLGMVGVVLTAVYTFRMIFIAFLGPERTRPSGRPGAVMTVPLLILAAAAALTGYLQTPAGLGNVRVLSGFLGAAVPRFAPQPTREWSEWLLLGASQAASALGILLAFAIFRLRVRAVEIPQALPRGAWLRRLWVSGWGFDWLYERIAVLPYRRVAEALRADPLNWPYRGLAWLADLLHQGLGLSQNGRVRRYAAAVTFGAALILVLVVML